MTIALFIAGLIIAFYCIFIFKVSIAMETNFSKSDLVKSKVSIVIPCRNEATNIGKCLRSIAQQTLSIYQFEIIVIDDFSEDATYKIATEFVNNLPLTVLKNTIAGKKNALSMGIEYAVNDIIITTDADCTMENQWLSNMLFSFEQKQLNMLCGPINFNDSSSLFQQLQQTESAAVVGISAAMMAMQKPATCNGANLMFKKSIFNQLNGYNHHKALASGDDDLLMQTFYNYDKKKVAYHLNLNAMVYTNACLGLKEFLNQRIRWLSKRKFYAYPWNQYLQLFILMQLMAFYYLFILAISTHSIIAIGLLINKLLFDLLLGIKLRNIFTFKYLLILLMPFYEIYIIVVLLYARFSKVKWKGRPL